MSFPQNRSISIVLETLQLSHDALSRHADELAGQLLGRIHGYGTQTVAMVTRAKAALQQDDVEETTKQLMNGLLLALEGLMEQLDKQNQVRSHFSFIVSTFYPWCNFHQENYPSANRS